MSFLNVNGGVPNFDGNDKVLKKLLGNQEILKTLPGSIMPKSQKAEKEEDKYKEFDNLTNNSKLGKKPLNEKDLLAKGFKEDNTAITTNGDRFFYNPITKEAVKIYNPGGTGEFVNIVYYVGNMEHSATYENGKEISGHVTLINREDDCVTNYQYKTEKDGTRVITDKKLQGTIVCF